MLNAYANGHVHVTMKTINIYGCFLLEQDCSLTSQNEWQAIIKISDAWTREHVSARFNNLIIQLTLILKTTLTCIQQSSHPSLNESKPDQIHRSNCFFASNVFNSFAVKSMDSNLFHTQNS